MSTSARDINTSIMRRSAPALRSPTTRQCCTASTPHPALPDHAAATSPTEDVCPRRLQRQLTNQPGLASQPQGEHRDHDQRATHPMKAIDRFHRSPPAQVDAPAEHNRDRRPRMTIVDRTDQVSGANRGISTRMTRRVLAFLALCLAVALVSWAPAAAASTDRAFDSRSNAPGLIVPGDNFFPESIAATPAGTLFVGSVVTGEILRFGPGSTNAETFVPAGVNTGTAGVLVD